MSDGNIFNLLGTAFDPSQHQPHTEPPEAQLRDAMMRAGVRPPKELVFDGALHRFATGKKAGDLSGWYIAHDDKLPAGCFGDWREGVTVNWRADIGRELTIAEQMAHTRRVADMKAQRERELMERRETAADKAADVWEAAAQASDDHPYLARKAVMAHGLRVAGDGRLIAPVFIGGELTSLQYIAGDGSKLFLKGGAIAGGCWLIGETQGAGTVYVCEGVATGFTLHEVTGCPVAITFSAGNMAPAGRAIRERLGMAVSMVVVADNDEPDSRGVQRGQVEGAKAAEAVGGRLVVSPVEGTDVNDFVQGGGDLLALLAPQVQTEGWLINSDDFASVPQAILWSIKGWLPQDALIMVHGPSGSGKTFVVLDMVLHAAAGLPHWCGFKVNPGPVVYLAGEGHQGLRARIAAWKRHNQVANIKNAWVSRTGCDLNTPDGYQLALEAIRALPVIPSTLVVDTLHRFLKGDENSAQDAKTMIDACAALSREFGCTVVLVHHTGVNEDAQHRARGSSAWRGALDVELSIVPGKEAGDPLTIIQRKQKDAELLEPMFMRLTRVDLDWIDEDGDRVSSVVATLVDADDVERQTQREGKLEGKSRKLFEDAFMAVGRLSNGVPFVSAAAWNEWTKTQPWDNDGKRRRVLSEAKKLLIDSGYLGEQVDGYIVKNDIAAQSLSLCKRNT
jgi:putative DNA primase/helicase